jgi:excisionase family DNA binding protein
MQKIANPSLLTPAEVARRLREDRATIYRKIRAGVLPAVRLKAGLPSRLPTPPRTRRSVRNSSDAMIFFASARRASAECPIACRRNQEKNAGETRGQGSLSRWPYLGWGQPVEGAAARERPALPCSPPRSLSPWLPREREAGVRGNWMLPSANADAPTSLSNLLLLGLHGIGESTDSRPINGKALQTSRFFWCLEGATLTQSTFLQLTSVFLPLWSSCPL